MEALNRFSQEEKDILRRSWKVLDKNLNHTAYNIFEMIFNQSPDTRQLFPFMKFNTGGRSKEIEFHALRFMQVLESVVKTLDNPETLNPLCDNLGRVHGRLSESRGFRTHHWGVFIECTLFHFRKVLGQDTYFHRMDALDKVIINWRIIIRLLIKQMKRGFNTDIKNRQASRELEESNKASTSSSPISQESCSLGTGLRKNSRQLMFLAVPGAAAATMSQSLTLPAINNNNYRKGSDSRLSTVSALSATSVSPAIERAPSTGLLRPLKEFARRRFINHF
ncbi:Globin domain-containing protein [Caenorhabditis elegans]|uniref:Globin domain-containing protein n=1 Tax=Caenorhabditis elegans TaxID=6239 RepID=Q7YZV1_CAEEL|nr:Globin family profile domain-containing protein [Caenorhabditis elegans]pir/T33129/ hypothetical protein C23H5.2 - Caenorhabditis elegans [Caenorhabditis elegans]CCD65343.1 Globin family profile domain-containing protein [Caenorhabditis elegans]|eukprot:NP_500166.3 GLoBin related [Caenorhabditis elegans]